MKKGPFKAILDCKKIALLNSTKKVLGLRRRSLFQKNSCLNRGMRTLLLRNAQVIDFSQSFSRCFRRRNYARRTKKLFRKVVEFDILSGIYFINRYFRKEF